MRRISHEWGDSIKKLYYYIVFYILKYINFILRSSKVSVFIFWYFCVFDIIILIFFIHTSMVEVKLKCSCWAITGVAQNVSPDNGNRIICHCVDCQSFAKYLKKQDEILDEYKGTDIYQMPISYIKITEWKEKIKCIRLTSKGLHRWYADCCKTPIGNTMWSGMAFMWVIHNFMNHQVSRDSDLWEVLANTLLKDNSGERKSTRFIVILPRVIWKLFIWKLKGLNKPSSFFNDSGKPIFEPIILDK